MSLHRNKIIARFKRLKPDVRARLLEKFETDNVETMASYKLSALNQEMIRLPPIAWNWRQWNGYPPKDATG